MLSSPLLLTTIYYLCSLYLYAASTLRSAVAVGISNRNFLKPSRRFTRRLKKLQRAHLAKHWRKGEEWREKTESGRKVSQQHVLNKQAQMFIQKATIASKGYFHTPNFPFPSTVGIDSRSLWVAREGRVGWSN